MFAAISACMSSLTLIYVCSTDATGYKTYFSGGFVINNYLYKYLSMKNVEIIEVLGGNIDKYPGMPFRWTW